MQKFGFLLTVIWLVGCSTPEVNTTEENTQTVNAELTENQAPYVVFQAPLTVPLKINDQEFFVEIADTREEREIGLMNREFMPRNQGMLFIFDGEAPRNFWMKNTLIPLDMIWIDANKTIVDIQAAEPCTTEECVVYSGKAPAQYVLELNPGVLKASVGDKAEF